MSQSCVDCPRRAYRAFCDLEPGALREFDRIKAIESLPCGTLLFREGQAARSAFVLCEGRVRLSVGSDNGCRMTLRVASPGEILGLSAVLAGGSYQANAEVIDTVQVAGVRRSDLLRFLREHAEICMQLVNLLCADLQEAYGRVRTVGLTRTRVGA